LAARGRFAKIAAVKRYACIHGHFYQPPRDNPWTGAVERQPSAGRDHDWNARVARECYVPNGEARVLDGDARIVDLVDNYEWMSFNFGPTLLAWFEKAHPHAYARLQEADRLSAARLGGHGNALAQAFHHSILPLAHPRDRRTEVLWGLADFRKRFGREAEGMWLPECAVDDATLGELAAAGVKFAILEPHQAADVRPLKGGAWTPADKALRSGVPYLWRGADGAELALFFYDAALSRAVAFERAMSDSRAYAARLAAAVPPTAEDGLALVATDGESYGHHDAFAEMGLAHLLRYALPEKGAAPVNLGWYLEKHPPRHEVRLPEGATSWSCAHGVERWRDDCGCGGAPGRQQRWRKPLREALEGLRGRLADLYERESAGLLRDPWAARDAYAGVVLDRSEGPVARFFEEHGVAPISEERRIKALRLLELQRHALMMFTSCGWFFDEISRLEPVQILLYAARALELARGFGTELEPEFVRALAAAPSNEAFGDGAAVWEQLVRPNVHTWDHVAAHYAVSLLFAEKAPDEVQGRRASCAHLTRRSDEGGTSVAAGRAEFVEPTTSERWSRSFFAAVLPGQRVQTFVCAGDLPEDRFEALLADAAQGTGSCPLPPGRLFRLRDLRPDEREKVLGRVLKRRLTRWETISRDAFEETLPLVEQYRGLGLPLPASLGEEARLALAHQLRHCAESFAAGEARALEDFRATVARGRAADVEILLGVVERPWERGVARLLDELERGFQDDSLSRLRDAAALAREVGLADWRPAAQTRFYRLLKSRPESALAREAAAALGLAA
jgi:alpha-amylase/alpha-mannosidase (GH57 family)